MITTTPFINNEAYLSGARGKPLEVAGLGPSLRVALWNIERGLELDYIELFLTNKDAFMAKVEEERKEAKENKKRVRGVELDRIPEEIEILKSADVWILNEVDWGVKRTEYREVVRELGKNLNMNWAYGVEFLEIDPKQLGTDKLDDGETEEQQQQLEKVFAVDKDRLRGRRSCYRSRVPAAVSPRGCVACCIQAALGQHHMWNGGFPLWAPVSGSPATVIEKLDNLLAQDGGISTLKFGVR